MTQQDPYLWLEEVEGEEALKWVAEQSEATLAEISADPRFEVIEEAALDVLNDAARIPWGTPRAGRDGAFVYNFWQDEVQVRGLWRRASVESYAAGKPEWDTLLDIDALARAEDENWVFQGTTMRAPDYTRAMVRLSRGGSDASIEREFDLTARQFVEGGFFLPEAKSIVAWMGPDTLLIRTDFGEGSLTTSGYGRIVKLWQRGTPLEEAEFIAEGALTDVGLSPASRYVGGRYLGFVGRDVTFFEEELSILSEGRLQSLPLPLKFGFFGVSGDEALILLRQDWEAAGGQFAAGTLISFSLEDFLEKGEISRVSTLFEPEERVSFETLAVSSEGVYLVTLDNVIARLSFARLEKGEWNVTALNFPDNGAINTIAASSQLPDVFVGYENFLTPPTLYHVTDEGHQSSKAMSLPERFDVEGLEVWQFEAESTDGTRIPYFVVAREEMALNGTNPTLLNAYGGFLISRTPTYSPVLGKGWLESGGVYVLANIRGGGEFGPDWHEVALKENRQICFDDFAAVAKDLIAKQITSPGHLGISGGSNGGLLVGATFTQNPDLFNAVLCDVPLLDMLRYHKLLAGASWIGEYGDPDIDEERAYIEEYSPYQNVKEGQTYPRVLFYTSTKDDRVHPGHARKMAARMKSQGHEPLFYENTEGGHGRGANMAQHARHNALQYTYLWRQLGRN